MKALGHPRRAHGRPGDRDLRGSPRRHGSARSGSTPARIDVTPLGVRVDGRAAALARRSCAGGSTLASGRWFCACRRSGRHKNLAALIRGHDRPRRHRSCCPARRLPTRRSCVTLARRLGVADRVRFPQWLEQAELEGLYRHAACFALPSFEEGFGLPALEAMGVACRSAARTRPRCLRSSGTRRCSSIPTMSESIRDAVARLLTERDLAARLASARGRARRHLHLATDGRGDARRLPAGDRTAAGCSSYDRRGGDERGRRRVGAQRAVPRPRRVRRQRDLPARAGARAASRGSGHALRAGHDAPRRARPGARSRGPAGRAARACRATTTQPLRRTLAEQISLPRLARRARLGRPAQPRQPRAACGAARASVVTVHDVIFFHHAHDAACQHARHALAVRAGGRRRRRADLGQRERRPTTSPRTLGLPPRASPSIPHGAGREPAGPPSRRRRRAGYGLGQAASCSAWRRSARTRTRQLLSSARPARRRTSSWCSSAMTRATAPSCAQRAPSELGVTDARAPARARSPTPSSRGSGAWRRAPRFPTLAEGFGLPVLEAMRARACRSPARTSRCCARWAATWRATSPRRPGRRGGGDRGRVGDAERRARRGRARAAGFTWEALPREARSRSTSARSRRALMRVGLNLVFLAPGETGGMEVYARELVARARRAATTSSSSLFLNRDGSTTAGPSVGAASSCRWTRGRRVEWVLRRAGARCRAPPPGAGLRPRPQPRLHGARGGPRSCGSRRSTTSTTSSSPRRTSACAGSACACSCRLAARRSHRVHRRRRVDARGPPRASRPPRREDRRRAARRRASGRTRPRRRRPSCARGSSSASGRSCSALRQAPAQEPARGCSRARGARRPSAGRSLVLPGYPTPHEEELRALAARRSASTRRAHAPAGSPRAELEGLYAAAACVVFPSLYEGFGLPVLEAMARGVPVACSNRASLPEVAGDAALLFDPEDVEAIRAAIERLLARRASWPTGSRAAGRGGRPRFSWERTAELTVAATGARSARSRAAAHARRAVGDQARVQRPRRPRAGRCAGGAPRSYPQPAVARGARPDGAQLGERHAPVNARRSLGRRITSRSGDVAALPELPGDLGATCRASAIPTHAIRPEGSAPRCSAVTTCGPSTRCSAARTTATMLDRAVIDLGSNIGISALYFLTRNADCRVWLYEPVPRNVERCARTSPATRIATRCARPPSPTAAGRAASASSERALRRHRGATGRTIEVACVGDQRGARPRCSSAVPASTSSNRHRGHGARDPARRSGRSCCSRVRTAYLEVAASAREAPGSFDAAFRNETWVLRNRVARLSAVAVA